MAVDMDRAREEHGHAQAKAETAATERIGNRYATVSFRQGHRAGYWDGFKRGAESADPRVAPQPPSGDDMTVAEFAAKHCAEHDEATQENVQRHVNSIILAAITRNRALWEVGVDAEGRVSLIWKSCPEFVWEALLAEGVQIAALMSLLGGSE